MAKYQTTKGTIADAESAVSDLQELGNECREIFDNAGEALQQTSRNQTMSETADALEYLELSASIPDDVANLEIEYSVEKPRSRREGLSRRARRDNAVALLTAAKDRLEAWQSEMESADDDVKEEVSVLIDELDEHIGTAENAEFPGMFG